MDPARSFSHSKGMGKIGAGLAERLHLLRLPIYFVLYFKGVVPSGAVRWVDGLDKRFLVSCRLRESGAHGSDWLVVVMAMVDLPQIAIWIVLKLQAGRITQSTKSGSTNFIHLRLRSSLPKASCPQYYSRSAVPLAPVLELNFVVVKAMNWVQRKIYLYNVTFGLYMLDWWERCLFNTILVVLMWYILYNGSKHANFILQEASALVTRMKLSRASTENAGMEA
ncbi:uncharacterized protein LOC133796496 isoform X1 [Humulus lupulus]|uniref:uncharacterized protein LOC133796496 isoform X1 n=1 Tax=Humulus lupulus TaxID=3486 RepID=UPI002B417E15|nr:uncharacterized protein LOC133796496 isoform X1 [Humulus lupulus]